MAAKEVKFGTEARERLLHGVDILANAVRVTLGPKGWLTVARFDIGTPGEWTLQGAPGDWAVSPDPLGAVKWWALGSTSMAIALVGAAACTGWIALKRPVSGQLRPSSGARGG